MIMDNIAVAPETHIAEICGGGRLSGSHYRAKRGNCELGPRTYGRQPKYAVPCLQTRRMGRGGSPRCCASRFSGRWRGIGGACLSTRTTYLSYLRLHILHKFCTNWYFKGRRETRRRGPTGRRRRDKEGVRWLIFPLALPLPLPGYQRVKPSPRQPKDRAGLLEDIGIVL